MLLCSRYGNGTTVNFPTLNEAVASVKAELVKQFGAITSETPGGTFSGSFNRVMLYTLTFAGLGGGSGGGVIQKKIAVRMGKEPSFKKTQSGGIWMPLLGGYGTHTSLRPRSGPGQPQTQTFAEIKSEAAASEQNWAEAHMYNLSPKLYFYGYVVKPPSTDDLYLCAISEGVTADLYDFYKSGPGAAANPTIDNNVRQQLTSLFNEMTKKMHMICFDIKPGNTVINYISPTNLTVKLIDWDADWCIKFDHLKQKHGIAGEILAPFTSVIMQVVMAMFFYFYFHNNIFATFFSTQGTPANVILTQHKDSLKVLFCKNNAHFQSMASWYFKQGMAIPSSCEALWDAMYKRVFYKNPTAFAAATSGVSRRWNSSNWG